MEFEASEKSDRQEKEFFCKKIRKLHLLIILGVVLHFLGGGFIYGYIFFLGLLAYAMRRDIPFKEAVSFRKKMTVPAFFTILPLTLALHFLGIVFGEIIDPFLACFNVQGNTIKGIFRICDGSCPPPEFWGAVYGGFVVPALEETICRGYIMGAYHQSNGSKVYAIFFSSVIFAAMHGDIINFIPYMFSAFFLAYTAMEYGIFWSMVYHGITNFLTSDILLECILLNMPLEKGYAVYVAFSAIIMACSIVILFAKRRKISRYIAENTCEREHVRLTFSSIPFWIFILLMLLLAISKLSPIE